MNHLKGKIGIGLAAIIAVAMIALTLWVSLPQSLTAASTTVERNTQSRDGQSVEYKMAAVKIYVGQLVCITSSTGYATTCSDTSGIVVVGVAEQTVDNSADDAGDHSIRVSTGKAYKFNNSASIGPISQDDIGKVCYVENGNIVATTSTNTIPVGVVLAYDSTGVWVTVPSPAWQTSLSAVYAVSHESYYMAGDISSDTTIPLFIAPKAGVITQAVLYCGVLVSDTATASITGDVLIGSTTIFSTKPNLAKTATAPDDTYASGTGVTVGVINTSADDFTAGQRIFVKADITEGNTVTTHSGNCLISVHYKMLVQ